MKSASAFCLLLLLFIAGAVPAGAAPSLVYSTWLGGQGVDIAVDSAGNAVVLLFGGSPGYDYSLAKLSPSGELIFKRPLELPSEPSMYSRDLSAVAVDPAGYIYVAGTEHFDNCLGRDPYQCDVNDSHLGFVAKLGPDGTGLFYNTSISNVHASPAHDLAVDTLGRAHLLCTITSREYEDAVSYGIRFSPAGSIERYFGYPDSLWSYDGSAAMAIGPSDDVFTVGWGFNYDEYNNFYTAAYLQRTDASSEAVVETILADSGRIQPVDVAGAPGGGSVVVGTVGRTVTWGVPKDGGFYIAEFGPAGEEIFSRVLNLGTVQILDIAVTSSGQIVLAGATWSNYFLRDPFILRLEGGTGEVISSMPGGWAVAVGPGGDAYVAINGYVSRYTENRPPVCSGATASPSVIWPPNGKMIPVFILGATDPDSDPVALKVTGISQDEPGAAFSGIGSSVAQVKAERDGKGDGRVYHILFEASDPSGASCTGEVTVCVPHGQGKDKGSCVDSGAPVSSSR